MKPMQLNCFERVGAELNQEIDECFAWFEMFLMFLHPNFTNLRSSEFICGSFFSGADDNQ